MKSELLNCYQETAMMATVYEGLDPSVCVSMTEDPIARHLPVNSVLGGFVSQKWTGGY